MLVHIKEGGCIVSLSSLFKLTQNQRKIWSCRLEVRKVSVAKSDT